MDTQIHDKAAGHNHSERMDAQDGHRQSGDTMAARLPEVVPALRSGGVVRVIATYGGACCAIAFLNKEADAIPPPCSPVSEAQQRATRSDNVRSAARRPRGHKHRLCNRTAGSKSLRRYKLFLRSRYGYACGDHEKSAIRSGHGTARDGRLEDRSRILLVRRRSLRERSSVELKQMIVEIVSPSFFAEDWPQRGKERS